MKTQPLFIVLILVVAITTTALAKIWRVDSNPGNWADFRTLQAANDSSFVVVGDTLYVAGSPIGYGNVTFTKRLVVIGPGYFLSENPNTQAYPLPASAAAVTFQATTSNGFLMMGMTTGQVNINANNITLRRNYLTSWVYVGLNNAVSNVTISQNYVWSIYLYNASNTNITISNNIIYASIPATTGASAIITQNVIDISNYTSNSLESYNSFVDNNIIYYGGISGTGNTYQNNIDSDQGGGTAFPAGSGNQPNVVMTTVFELTGSSDGRWKLQALSPALAAGSNGYDIGAFGGPSPYVLSGIPPIPAIYNVSAPTFGTGTQGLQVQVKTKSHN